MDNFDVRPKKIDVGFPWRAPSPATVRAFRIRTVGKVEGNARHVTPGTWHEDAMLTLVVAGRGRYEGTEGDVELSAGMVGLVLPGGDPGCLRALPQDPYCHYYCRFAGHEALELARGIRAPARPTFWHWEDWEEGALLWEQMLRWGVGPSSHRGAEPPLTPAEGLLAHLLARLAQAPGRGTPRLSAARLRAYVLDHLGEAFSLARMARQFGVSKSHLCREAQRLLGESPQRYAQREKMAWAARLLADPQLGLSVSETAYRLGFSDPLYFSRVYTRHHGSSPRQHRVRDAGRVGSAGRDVPRRPSRSP